MDELTVLEVFGPEEGLELEAVLVVVELGDGAPKTIGKGLLSELESAGLGVDAVVVGVDVFAFVPAVSVFE